MIATPLSWTELEALTDFQIDRTNRANNAQFRLRLFGKTESDVRVTLYRDNHAWCPYCQKIWLWLEEKQIPYRIDKVTMFCYGEKKVGTSGKYHRECYLRSNYGDIITESDDILIALERVYGGLGLIFNTPQCFPCGVWNDCYLGLGATWLCTRRWRK